MIPREKNLPNFVALFVIALLAVTVSGCGTPSNDKTVQPTNNDAAAGGTVEAGSLTTEDSQMAADEGFTSSSVMEKKTEEGAAMVAKPTTSSTKASESKTTSSPAVAPKKTTYKDGNYLAKGDYRSPGGSEDIGVSVTLKDGVIVDSAVEVHATSRISKRMQEVFADGYKQYVIGKKIDEVSLSKVSGSSLTPAGFNDALVKIKAQAKG